VTRRIAVIVNPAAGGGAAGAAIAPVRAELDRLGVEHRVVETRSADHAHEEGVTAAGAGETVAAVGGDGIVGVLAGALRNTDSALALIPGGRGNDFARVLGIPTDPAAAARLAVEGEERLIDVAEAGGRSFVGIASVGFDSVANKIANESKLIQGNLVYAYAALRALVTWKDATFEVIVDGERHTLTGFSIAVANSKAYGGGMYAVPQAQLDDGLLDVVLSEGASRMHHLKLVPKAFKGTHVDDPTLHFTRGRTVEVRADRPFTMYADGDPIAELPATVTVAHRVLRVIVPR
jgi:YegS/Rv2252/BmrU family lipid kinase